jgi:hypothetical protein
MGNVRFAGKAPVLNVNGAEVVPSFRTCLIRYVVSGSIPATRMLVLFPGTMGAGLVLRQDGLGLMGANWTYNELPAEGGAPYSATRGLDVGLITALVPTTRDCAV